MMMATRMAQAAARAPDTALVSREDQGKLHKFRIPRRDVRRGVGLSSVELQGEWKHGSRVSYSTLGPFYISGVRSVFQGSRSLVSRCLRRVCVGEYACPISSSRNFKAYAAARCHTQLLDPGSI